MNIKFYKPLIAVFVLSIMISCNRDEVFPELGTGVNMRIQLDSSTPTIDAQNIPAASVLLDMYSVNTDVSTVELFADFYSLSQDSTYNRALVKTVNGSDFSGGELQNLAISTQEIATAVGIDLADMGGGDQVTFVNITTLTDGRVYPSTFDVGEVAVTNTTPNILASAPTTSFTSALTVFLACPVDPGFATGSYMMEQISGPADPFFGQPTLWGNKVVTFNAASPISRIFGDGTYAGFDAGFEFFLICNQIVVPDVKVTGASCGGPGFIQGQEGELPTYTEPDDAVFEWSFTDNIAGGCGIGPAPITLRFTKI